MSTKHWLILIGTILVAYYVGKKSAGSTAQSPYTTATYPPDQSQYPTYGPIPL